MVKSSNDTLGVITRSQPVDEHKKWWRRFGQATPRAVPARDFLSILTSLGREAGRMVLPSPCIACSEELPWKSRVTSCCQRCWDALPRIGHAKCVRCAMPWASAATIGPFTCISCQENPGALDWIEAWGHYGGTMARVIHSFKFERHDFLGDPLGLLMVEALRARHDGEFDVITFVPMHASRLRARGYNQSELLARSIHKAIGVPLRAMLAKTRDNDVQSTLPRSARKGNVRGAFLANASKDARSVLLVDDICTTGETLQACASALMRAGAERVCALVLARA